MANGMSDGTGGVGGNNGPGGRVQRNRGSDAPTSSGDDASGATRREKTKFGKFMSDVGNAALDTVATVAPVVPGGELLADAANGLQGLRGGAPSELSGTISGDQLDSMWEMQQQNQVYNMQYLELQTEMQRENRHFKTMSNLMKVRHDTAKSAIDNMRA